MPKTYKQKLKDKRWKQKRLEILKRDNFTCCECGSEDKPLHVHHGFYHFAYKNPWDYPNISMWTLCGDCHSKAHDIIHDLHIEISKINPFDLYDLVKIVNKYRSNLGDNAHQKEFNPSSKGWE